MDRRSLLIGSGLWALRPAAFITSSAPALSTLARKGGVILIRHASTAPGVGDPPYFTLGQCGTQRNLSPAGWTEAIDIGVWFRQHGLQPQTVFAPLRHTSA